MIRKNPETYDDLIQIKKINFSLNGLKKKKNSA